MTPLFTLDIIFPVCTPWLYRSFSKFFLGAMPLFFFGSLRLTLRCNFFMGERGMCAFVHRCCIHSGILYDRT